MNLMANRLVQNLKGTPAELSIEPAIAALGLPYRFQLPLWIYEGGLRYFPDFVIPDLNLVIEVDDPSHARKVEEDAERAQAILKQHGWRVVRCTNEEALRAPYEAVARMLGGCREAKYTRASGPMRLPKVVTPRGYRRKQKKDRKTDRLPDRIPDRAGYVPKKRKDPHA